MTAPVLISITGPDGAGKSTLINALKQELPNCAVLTIWDLLRDAHLQQLGAFKSPQDVDSYLSVLHHESRSLFLMHCLLEALERAKSKKPRYIIADGYWYKYYATEVSHGTSAAYLDKITAIFEVPDLLFYIRTTEQTTMERKTSFSRYECGFAEEPNAQSFSDFQHEAIAVLELLMASKDPVIVQGHDSPSECLNTVLQRLKIYHHENFYHYRN